MDMFNKLYNRVINFIKENNKYIIFLLCFIIIINIKLPYSIECPGGLINIEERLDGDIYKSKGSINLTYVTMREGNIPSILISLINSNWDIISNKSITYDNETMKESNIRSSLDYESSIKSSYYVAYEHANKNPQITDNHIYVQYILDEADTNLRVGDEILSVDDVTVDDLPQFYDYVQSLKEGDEVKLEVKNNQKKYQRYAKLIKYEDKVIIGITVINIPDIEVKPAIEYARKDNENGPSGGLMFSLAIYNSLIEEDITKGKVISGTGTISLDGTVGEISGVKYKLSGAVKNGAHVFIVPEGNYEEAIKLKNSNKYDIEIIKAINFKQVLEELKNLK